ncbi:hypothetical protein F4679DRAFT_559995 [Xylaria curta]|nr:hypothetical protein F4679DRAFT_559995 [Xylaria curta]
MPRRITTCSLWVVSWDRWVLDYWVTPLLLSILCTPSTYTLTPTYTPSIQVLDYHTRSKVLMSQHLKLLYNEELPAYRTDQPMRVFRHPRTAISDQNLQQ